MKEIFFMELKVVLDIMFAILEFTKEDLSTETFLEMELLHMLTIVNIKGNGKTVLYKDLEYSLGPMETDTKDNIQKVLNMEKELSFLEAERYLKEIGKMVKNMAKVN